MRFNEVREARYRNVYKMSPLQGYTTYLCNGLFHVGVIDLNDVRCHANGTNYPNV